MEMGAMHSALLVPIIVYLRMQCAVFFPAVMQVSASIDNPRIVFRTTAGIWFHQQYTRVYTIMVYNV